jgi:predicted XRE-type DNA-binding protein
MRDDTTITKSSGNVFADLGIPNPKEHEVKAEIVLRIIHIVKARKLTQAQASKLIGLAQPDVSKILRGHFAGYSYDRLLGFLTALGEKVTITVSTAKTAKDAKLELEFA